MISGITIHNVASYKSEATLKTDKKVNVIYGLNGSGKSTLSNFLYKSDEEKYCDCSVDMADDASLYVYNQRFVEDNFFEEDSLKGIFSLSKENKEIKGKIESLQSQLKSHLAAVESEKKISTDEVSEILAKKSAAYEVTWRIKLTYADGDKTLAGFLGGLKAKKEVLFTHLASVSKPDQRPVKDIDELKLDVTTLTGKSAEKYSDLPLIDFSAHDVETDPIFDEAIVGNTNSSVATLIEQLQNSDWVQKGLQYVERPTATKNTSCPFCQSDTISIEIASQVEKYFDESYSASLNKIETLLARYSTALEHLPSLESYKANPLAVEKFSELTAEHRLLVKMLEENIRAIETKRTSPSGGVSLACTRSAVQRLNCVLKVINSEVLNHNEKLENAENELQLLKRQFWRLMRWEYDQTISSLERQVADSKDRLTKSASREKIASKAVEAKKREILQLQKSTVNIDEAVTNINEGLLQIGISDFSIAKHDESLYKIVRLGNSAAEFSSLSEGEKMIISFLYFCELCKGKRSVTDVSGKKVAVIDDPISSLSHVFVFNIGRLIKSDFFDSQVFEQVFVLTHSLYFFYELADSNHKKRNENQKLFRLIKNNSGSQILSMSYEEVQNDYHSYWSIVTDSNQPPALIANCMRNIVEYFFNFVQKQDLGTIIQRTELQANRYQAFCRYINRESHSLGQNIFDYKEFDYESFRDGLKLVFEATGYVEHYNKMISVIGKKQSGT